MAKQFNPHRYTRNRIGDWIDNNALAELKRDEKLLEQEKNINLQRLRENLRKQEQIFRDGMTRLISEMTAQKKELEDKLVAEKERREIEERKLKEQIVQLVQQNGELEEQVKEIVHQLNMLFEEKKNNVQIAEKYINEANAYYQSVISDEICIKFSEGKLVRVENLINRLNAPNLSSEVKQAIAITILSDLFELKHHAERENKKFLPKYESLIKQTKDFLCSLDVIIYLSNNKESPLDIDHWTNNLYERIKKTAEQFLVHVENGLYAIDYQIPQIKEDEAFLDDIIQQKNSLISQAKKKATQSQQIAELGEKIVKCLTDKNKFIKIICKYENDDDRGILVVELEREFDRKKLTFLFFPDSTTPFSPLCIFRQGSFMNAVEYQEFCEGIFDSLKKIGIIVSFHDPKLRFVRYEDETFVPGESQLCENIHHIISLTLKNHYNYE